MLNLESECSLTLIIRMKLDITNRQIEIIKASGKILMEKGIVGLTTKNLAAEIGFSESALYRHFKDKESIISLLIQYLAENINERFTKIMSSDLNGEEKYLAVFGSQFQFFKDNPHYIAVILSDGLMDSSEVIKESIKNLIQRNSKFLIELIENGKQNHFFTHKIDTEDMVHIMMGTFRLQMLKWKMADFSFDITEKGMKTMKGLLTLIKN